MGAIASNSFQPECGAAPYVAQCSQCNCCLGVKLPTHRDEAPCVPAVPYRGCSETRCYEPQRPGLRAAETRCYEPQRPGLRAAETRCYEPQRPGLRAAETGTEVPSCCVAAEQLLLCVC
ncbi:hypothetical protein NHX12_020648 [Muraenolepis orangiensis]|uniref:Uncharacterized protein n=1 Tax=Muraenolepis orangiensis TaxID=630683 RepID=A0A9Q0IT82_9TELE|nr:hypothetical protein NHX12_020648 [Muraenolepis orangiensis]